jgi:predicted transcriptional regulator
MTTLDRLFAKGMLDRSKEGRAYLYRARISRQELASLRVRDALGALLEGGSDGRQPALSMLIDTVTAVEVDALDELERLIREKRRTELPEP